MLPDDADFDGYTSRHHCIFEDLTKVSFVCFSSTREEDVTVDTRTTRESPAFEGQTCSKTTAHISSHLHTPYFLFPSNSPRPFHVRCVAFYGSFRLPAQTHVKKSASEGEERRNKEKKESRRTCGWRRGRCSSRVEGRAVVSR